MATISKQRNSWRVQIRRKGHEPISRTFPSKAAASRWAREEEHRLDQMTTVPAGLRLTMGDLIDTYEVSMTKRAGRTKAATLKVIRGELAHHRLDELTPKVFVDYAMRRARAGAGPATVTIDLAYIGTVLRHAGSLADAVQPCTIALASLAAARGSLRHVGTVGRSRERTRRISMAEVNALLEHWLARRPGQTPMMDLALFAIATCMRLGEICRIEWKDFDAAARTIVIRDRKHPSEKLGNDEKIPLLTHTTMWGLPLDPCRLIKRQPVRLKDPRIFPYKPASVSTMFTRAVAACDIIDLNFHDLRHEGISRMFESGYSIEQVALVSGHKSWDMLRRYTQIDPVSLHRA